MKTIIEINKLIEPYFVEWQTEVDITAIVRYLNKKWFVDYKRMRDSFMYCQEDSSLMYFRNKPLNLFDNTELKELIKILNKTIIWEWQITKMQ